MKTPLTIAVILLIIGGINWGLVGLFEYDLVAAIFGELSTGARIIYVLVGLAAVFTAVALPFEDKRRLEA